MARILALALLLRVLLPAAVVVLRGDPASLDVADTRVYLALARSLVNEGRFGSNGEPELFRLPLYPLLLVPGVWLGQPRLVAVLLQAVLGCASVYAAMRCAALAGLDERMVRVAGLLCAVEPGLLVWGSVLMPEAPFVAAATLAAWCWLAYFRRGGFRWLALAILAAAVAAYTKPIAYLFPLWIAALAAVLARQRRHAAAAAGLALLLLLPWHARNLLVAGYPLFSSQFDQELRVRAMGVIRSQHTDEEKRARILAEWRVHEPAPVVSLRPAAAGVLAAEPLRVLYREARGVLRTLLSPGASKWAQLFGLADEPELTRVMTRPDPAAALAWLWNGQRIVLWMTAALGLMLAPYLILPVLALARGSRTGRPARLALLAIAAYFLLLSGGAAGQSRFRLPFVPILAVLAADGLAAWRARRRE